MTAARRTNIFISYSREDSEWLTRLQVHLAPLEREHGIEIWDDTKIGPGSNWQESIRRALENARVAVILISADFFHSKFITSNELPALLSASESEGVLIVPLIVSASRFPRDPSLGKFQAINPTQPLIEVNRGERERILDELSHRIELLLSDSHELAKGSASDTTSASASLPSLQKGEAAECIREHARLYRIGIRSIEKAPTSAYGSDSYRARTTDGKGVIYCHINGKHRGQSFYVSQGIGWFYEILLGGAESRLGLPISDEEIAEGTQYPTSQFERGYIEWSRKTEVARAVFRTDRGVDQTLAEKKL